MLHFHNNIINIHNSFNEYLFNSSATIENMPALTFLEKTITNTFDTIIEDVGYEVKYYVEIPGLDEVFLKVQKEPLCDGIDICDPAVAKVTALGYYSFAIYWINEVKVKVYYAKELHDQKYKTQWDTYPEERAIFLFNILHEDIDSMFNFVALHFIELETTSTAEKILEKINSRSDMYITLYIILILVIIFIYVFYWYPIITDTQVQIYQTKLALNIILYLQIQG